MLESYQKPMKKKSAFITGANGFIGSHLVKYLLEQGWSVNALVRKGSDLSRIDGLPVTRYYGDLFSTDAIKEGMRNCGYIFHVAGVIDALNPDEFYRVNARGTEHLVSIVEEMKDRIERFLYVSSISVMGPSSKNSVLNEHSPLLPISDYGKSKREAEIAVLKSRLRWTIVRPTNILGTGQKELFAILSTLRYGLKPLIGKREAQTTICFVDDLVRGMVLAVLRESSLGKTYIIASQEAYSFRFLLNTAARILGKKRMVPVPFTVLYLFAVFSRVIASVTGQKPLMDPAKLVQARRDYWFHDSSCIKRELGFRTEIPAEEGLAAIIEYYKENNWKFRERAPGGTASGSNGA